MNHIFNCTVYKSNTSGSSNETAEYDRSWLFNSSSMKRNRAEFLMWLLKIIFKSTFPNRSHWSLQHTPPKKADPKIYTFYPSVYEKKDILQSQMLINTFESVLKVNEFLSSLWDSPSIKLQAHFIFPFKSPIKGTSPPMQRKSSALKCLHFDKKWINALEKKQQRFAGRDGLLPRPSDTYSNCWVLTPTPADEQPERFWPCGVCESMGSW